MAKRMQPSTQRQQQLSMHMYDFFSERAHYGIVIAEAQHTEDARSTNNAS